MDGVVLTNEMIIPHPKGDILHVLKPNLTGFKSFGEAYISKVNQGEIKGWKMHKKMTLNLVVPLGRIEIAVSDNKSFFSVVLSTDNYKRLTIEPNLWVAFKGLSANNMLLNIASHAHDPNESIDESSDMFNFKWSDVDS
jgi:dTDP-4-dehydrorhamnose 3,5-epimerase|tara:strand:+ start:503 stop:919 length:417 start_codon:yes stop_codon:yes gene_type:complete